MDHSPLFERRRLEASQRLASVWQGYMKGYLVRYTIKSRNYGRDQFLGSKKMPTTYPSRASARLRTLGSTFSFACDAALLRKYLVDFPVIRGDNVLTKRSKKSEAMDELV